MSATLDRPRRLMRDTVGIGQRWRRRSDGTIITITQVHRADRQVEAIYEQPRPTVTFRDLRTRYELIGGGR